MLGSLLILTSFLVFGIKTYAGNSTDTHYCSCGYRQSGQLLLLRCSSRDDLASPTFRPVLCQRVGDTVRIGDSTNLGITEAMMEGFVGMAIEPFGLSQLQEGGRVTELQINLPLQAKLMDSFTFAGLPDLVTLQAWRAPIALESCSLAGLPSLENLVVSCTSTFDRFLSFGPGFKSIRLTGCSGQPLQFICSMCSQRPEISVLRILPGPPSRGGILSFQTGSNSTKTNSSISLHTCQPGVCSDDHLCRHNYPLKVVRGSNLQGSSHKSTIKPLIITHSQSNSGRQFLTLFLPIVLVILAISTAICMFISTRILKAFGRKRCQPHSLNHCQQAPQNPNWSTLIPLNDYNTKA